MRGSREVKSSFSKRKLAGILAAVTMLGGAGISIGNTIFSIGSKNPNETPNPTPDKTIESPKPSSSNEGNTDGFVVPTASPEVTATPEPSEDLGTTNTYNNYSSTFRDLSEEEVYGRAAEIQTYFDELAPYQGVTTEEIVEMLNYINGGVVTEVSREAALNVIQQIEVLMNGEINYAVDMVNKGESGRTPTTTVIDYGMFCIDGSKAQRLASEISLYREGMLLNLNNDEGKENAISFTTLLMKSWYLNGHEAISAYALEVAGRAAFIDKLFLNTAMLAGAYDQNLSVINPLTDEPITLMQIVEEINKADCQAELEAENGDIVTTYINKFSYDMQGMLVEATSNKHAYEENKGLTLKPEN